MADSICPVCGEKVGGLTGMRKPTANMILEAKAVDVYKEGMCASCLAKALTGGLSKQEELAKANAKIQEAVDKVFVSPAQIPDNATDLGLVTGYCILGTGPFSALFSSVTDIFGMKSNAYYGKAQKAEKEALSLLKLNALEKGADAVYCIRVNLTEATSGNGMLMVSVAGAAVKTASPNEKILEAIEILQK